MQLKSHETVQLDSNLWPMESTLWNMNYEGKSSQKNILSKSKGMHCYFVHVCYVQVTFEVGCFVQCSVHPRWQNIQVRSVQPSWLTWTNCLSTPGSVNLADSWHGQTVRPLWFEILWPRKAWTNNPSTQLCLNTYTPQAMDKQFVHPTVTI